jgi:hypothetical protein
MCWSHGVGVYRCLVSGGLSVTLPGQFFFGGVLVPYPFVSQPTFSPLTHFFQFKERCGFELVAVGRLCRDGFLTCGLLATWACIKTLPERISRLLKFFFLHANQDHRSTSVLFLLKLRIGQLSLNVDWDE